MKLREQFRHGDVVQILDAPKGQNIGTVISVGYRYVQVNQGTGDPSEATSKTASGHKASNLRKITT